MSEISKEYGAALFMLACEKDKKDEYSHALEKAKKLFDENPDYMEFLSSPSISKGERLAALAQAFGAVLPEDVVSYLQLLCEKGRMACFFESAEEYGLLLDASKSVQNAKITSAVELSDDEKEKLKKKLEATSKSIVNTEYFIDESLLGGVVVEMSGTVIDGSLRTRLRDIKEVIST